MKRHWQTLIALTLVLATYLRLYFGVDLMDESGYIGIAYTFTKGARPFFDEVATTQNVSILTFPFVKIYTTLIPSADGLVLAMRHLYFLCTLLVGGCIYSISRRILPTPRARLISLIPVSFVPFSIASLSYNTVCALGLVAGSFSFLRSLDESSSLRSRLKMGAISAFAFCTATFGYPTLAMVTVPAVFFCLYRAYQQPKPSERSWAPPLFWAILIPALFWTAAVAVTLSYAGIANMRRSIDYYNMLGVNFGGAQKFTGILNTFLAYRAYFFSVIGILVAMALMGQKFGRLWWLYFAIIPFMYQTFKFEPAVTPLLAIFYFGLAPLAWIARPSQIKNLGEIRFFWLISLTAGMICAWTSSNGVMNSCLGLLLGSALNLYILAQWIQGSKVQRQTQWAFDASVILFLGLLVVSNYRDVYQDGPPAHLREMVSSGAYAGIRTIPEKKLFIEKLSADLAEQREKYGTQSVTFFDDFPAGYLLSEMRRHSESIWTPSSGSWLHFDRNLILQYYLDHPDQLPDVAVHMLSYPARTGVSVLSVTHADDPILKYLSQPPYHPVVQKSAYVIYRRDSPQ